jgi:hypothetical protein
MEETHYKEKEMNPTIKTFDDGSEFTAAHAGAVVVIGLALSVTITAATAAVRNWKDRRFYKKTGFINATCSE